MRKMILKEKLGRLLQIFPKAGSYGAEHSVLLAVVLISIVVIAGLIAMLFIPWTSALIVALILLVASVGIIVSVVGQSFLPYAILTIMPDGSDSSGKKEITVLYDGRVLTESHMLPAQIRLYFLRRGEYEVYIRLNEENYTWMVNFYAHAVPHIEIRPG